MKTEPITVKTEGFFIRARFTKSDRLRKRREFVDLSRRGKSVSDRYFILSFQPNGRDRSRLGITVTKKVGNAVIRNRLKRIVREFFRHNRSRINGSLDINVIVKQSAAGVSSQRAHALLHGLVDRIEDAGSRRIEK